MKVHKFRFGGYPEQWAYCNRYVQDCYSLSETTLMARYWENVTCKRCLAKKPKKRGRL